MHERFVIRGYSEFTGFWGGGDTLPEATANFLKAAKIPSPSGRVKALQLAATWRFESDLPFAPSHREATEGEADAYVDETGACCWIRCERFEE